jgi:hypothetical protein
LRDNPTGLFYSLPGASLRGFFKTPARIFFWLNTTAGGKKNYTWGAIPAGLSLRGF